MKMLVFAIFTLFTRSLLFCISSEAVDINMKKLSFLDRYCMNVFFDEAIKKDQASHVIFFNNKPVCLTGPALKYQHKRFKDILSLRGWRAFKEKEHLFPHPNFIFTENVFGDSKDFKILHIYIINKSSLKSCLEKHLSAFQEILGDDFSPDKFISYLEEGKSLLSLVKKDELLIGLLLGFGENSSRAFKEMLTKFSDNMPPPQTDSYHRIDLKTPNDCKINPVVFMGNPNSEEVKQLALTYERELEETWSIYKNNKNSLRTTLERLCAQ